MAYSQTPNRNSPRPQPEGFEQVLQIRRVSKKTQGGSQVAFSALVVTGDKKGKVGLGLAKAPNVADAIKKSIRLGNRDLVMVPIKEGTIPYETKSKFGAAEVLLRPAPKGTGIIAGSAVRAVVEAAGITDIVCKSLGSNNKTTNARATFKALKHIELLDKKYKLLKIK
ncbi:MAG: 30S ribosomal protein S5 [Candidatus Collierbacteria bacterium GW2011_GWB1_44_35]|uniref:Small ribosomal subunit protein uS5 n=6 Tax=Candidatus Collieribacteriota TaxID=1752725 RepID=A0A0G1JTI5_9BACT|nr:MAG: 30S ribosomal protein S5 [Candidatus Collierbacteria bacterium GW2011_GWA1_44_12]KKT39425.1 MAG: 30S ribosomal protein S5 [Candidatus Collierbacteria bacterium GW2011_GWF1_44_12]KKT47242.1 MAG: 30S ribosomal protein S5 [Candidatus Collierbacteria bacterium GW2011_GWF2_44_15]KKT68156.1 MAG: 30S ribosomal protein S5 [Candidatus Collierbacteria bacterium GW2011_GWB1_44_35]KKU00406.1 MAG: 30S ribosomal protein S5 [Candidatus Collierbacteria bacterium GW2011_GWC2_45_15]KKU30556.1 MAG: 30S r